MRSASSSGEPRGPYQGPVYSKRCAAGRVCLNGSHYWEGTYFVFVQVHAPGTPGDAPRALSSPRPVEEEEEEDDDEEDDAEQEQEQQQEVVMAA